MHARSAKRPSLVAADALDSPSGESWRAKLGAEQAQVSATSIRKSRCRETVVTASAVARHHWKRRGQFIFLLFVSNGPYPTSPMPGAALRTYSYSHLGKRV